MQWLALVLSLVFLVGGFVGGLSNTPWEEYNPEPTQRWWRHFTSAGLYASALVGGSGLLVLGILDRNGDAILTAAVAMIIAVVAVVIAIVLGVENLTAANYERGKEEGARAAALTAARAAEAAAARQPNPPVAQKSLDADGDREGSAATDDPEG